MNPLETAKTDLWPVPKGLLADGAFQVMAPESNLSAPQRNAVLRHVAMVWPEQDEATRRLQVYWKAAFPEHTSLWLSEFSI